jgi:DNA-binding response OmpR family regulator
MRILLVEDEEDMARLVTTALSRHDVIVDHAPNLEYAEEAVQAGVHDAVLLDRKLPDGEGLSLIPVIRRVQPGLPIIVLSALGSPENRVAGLDGGADDYLAKPFSVDELLARLRAVMRRPAQIGQDVVTVGRLRFNLNDRSAEIDGAPIELPRRELLTLETLVRRSGRTVPRGALEEAVYGFDDDIASNTLDAHISRLRRKLVPANVEIHAIRGLGYLLRVAA